MSRNQRGSRASLNLRTHEDQWCKIRTSAWKRVPKSRIRDAHLTRATFASPKNILDYVISTAAIEPGTSPFVHGEFSDSWNDTPLKLTRSLENIIIMMPSQFPADSQTAMTLREINNNYHVLRLSVTNGLFLFRKYTVISSFIHT